MFQQTWVKLTVNILGVIILNVIAAFYFVRLDLTEERRYTITEPTKKILRELKGEVYFKIYLTGQLPAGFRRLKNTIQETLDEFQTYAGKNLKYRFIDLNEEKNIQKRNKLYKEIIDKGIVPTNIFDKENGQRVERIIFPGALVYYDKYEMPLMLFKTIDQRIQGAPSPEQILNQSVENVEYNLISAIKKITQTERKRIGFIEGHGELQGKEIADIQNTLQETYDVYRVNLPQSEVIEGLDAIIIAKPDSAFSENDIFKIDQFIMRGGKALFFLDAVGVYMDSVLKDKGSFTFPYSHKLGDMLFRYGVRVNTDLLQDLNAGVIPLVVGNMGTQPQVRLIPWVYHPLLNNFSKHPIVKNLGALHTKFISSVDTVKAKGIRKTPLVFTSKYTKKVGTPTFVTFNEARKQPNPQTFKKGMTPVAWLLEGKFTSVFKNRLTDADKRFKDFIPEGQPSKILIFGDGDLIKNDIHPKTQKPIPLGLDPILQTNFSNKDFIINALDYMLDDKGIILAKNKEVILRPLDKLRIIEERSFWQIFNLVLPTCLIVLFGIVWFAWRKAKFGKK
ncbi:MAG: gliding motility-associated ABC transporter substrate-binding protein GldG [Microscillaceae bacterium]|nr:gliding motility-associated ABC transporter substrate-binding protein GldG [Microscillaceae bacterium]MDW8461476.1 gliding motility-associated ABC transporter substrate-binding protein GldG [Cytophagales bacterium]